MKSTFFTIFAMFALMTVISAQHPCYTRDEASCKQDANCAFNFVHHCCSPSNGPVCAHHAAFVHSVPQVYPTSINHPLTHKPIAQGPPVVVHHPVVHHPVIPHPVIPHPYVPHPLVYSQDKKSKLRGGK